MPVRLGIRDFGNSLKFDAATAYVSANSQLFYQNTGYTVSCWVKPNSQNSSRFLCLANSSSNNQVWIMEINNYTIDLLIRNDANSTLLNTSVTSTTKLNPGQWYHIAFVDNNGTVTLYINGIADATSFNYTRSGTFTIDRTGIGALVRSVASSFFDGWIDDVRIWNNTQLSATDVLNLYQWGTNPATTPTSWYKFNEGSGTTANDSGSLATNATITAATFTTDTPTKLRAAASSRSAITAARTLVS